MFNVFRRLSKLVRNLRRIVSDCLSLFANIGRCRLALAAENLFDELMSPDLLTNGSDYANSLLYGVLAQHNLESLHVYVGFPTLSG
jgi:hypothetical protein